MTKNKNYLVVGAIALVIGFILGVLGYNSSKFGVTGGAVSYTAQHFVGDVYSGMTDVLMFQSGVFKGPITSSQAVTLSGTNTLSGATSVTGGLTIGASGTSIGSYVCATKSFGPITISSSTDATTTITVANAALGDVALGSSNAATSSLEWNVSATVSSASTTMLTFRALRNSAAWTNGLTLTTSTLKACVIH